MPERSDGKTPKRNHDKGGLPPWQTPRIQPDGRLALVDRQANSRLIVFLVGNFLHRIECERCELCFGDLESPRWSA